MNLVFKLRLLVVWVSILILVALSIAIYKRDNVLQTLSYTTAKKIRAQNRLLIQKNPSDNAAMIIENSKDILRRIPLDSEALAYIAFSQNLLNSDVYNLELIQAARKKNPRNKNVRKALLFNAQNNANALQIVEEVSILLNLDPKNKPIYIEILTDLYNQEEGREVVNAYLKNGANWSFDFLRVKIDALISTEVDSFTDSMNVYLSVHQNSEAKKLISKFSYKLIDLGLPRKSHMFWSINNNVELTSIEDTPKIYNHTFSSKQPSGPFNWTLNNNKSVSTEYIQNGGLYANFRGRSRALIARQGLRWKSQSNLEVEIQGNHSYDEGKGNFLIEIRCQNSQDLLADFVIPNLISDTQFFPITSSPNDCPFAYLDIIALPGAYAEVISAEIYFLDIFARP